MRHSVRFSLFLLLCVSTACLPEDVRPKPAEIRITGTSVGSVFTTADGWQVDFERALLSVSSPGLQEKHRCDDYADAKYTRILNLLVPGQQRFGQLYGVGGCELIFSAPYSAGFESVVRTPHRGEGVSEQDAAFMQQRLEPGEPLVRLHVAGRATRNGVQKTFSWTFGDEVVYFCELPTLTSGAALTYDIPLDAGQLFDVGLASGVREFNAIADADSRFGDDNGDVTLSELELVTRSDLPSDRYDGWFWANLGDYLRTVSSPKVASNLGPIKCSFVAF